MTPSRHFLDSPEFRKAYPLWDGDPFKLIPTTPLTDEEIEVLRSCDGTPEQLKRLIAGPGRSCICRNVWVLPHIPTRGAAFAMTRDSLDFCSSTAVLYATGEVVPIQECKTGLPL